MNQVNDESNNVKNDDKPIGKVDDLFNGTSTLVCAACLKIKWENRASKKPTTEKEAQKIRENTVRRNKNKKKSCRRLFYRPTTFPLLKDKSPQPRHHKQQPAAAAARRTAEQEAEKRKTKQAKNNNESGVGGWGRGATRTRTMDKNTSRMIITCRLRVGIALDTEIRKTQRIMNTHPHRQTQTHTETG